MLTLSSRWCQQPEDILDLVDHVDNAGQIAMSAAVALQVARQRLLQQVRRAASGDAPAVDVATHEAANQACLEADEAAAAVQSAQIDEKTREERAQLAAGWAQAELVTMQLLHSIEITINDGRSQSAASGASTDATAWQTGVSSIDADLSIEELRKELQESKLQHKTAKATIDRLKGEMKTQELRSTSESTRMQEELENAQRLIEAAMSGDTHGLVEEMKQSLALVEAERDDALATAGAARNAKLASKTALVAARATSAANARKHESAVAEKDAVVEQMHEVEAAKDVAERKIQELNLAAQSSAMAAEQEKANLQQKLAETQQLYDALISGNTDTVVVEMQQQLETAKGHRDEAQVQQQAAVAKVDEAQSELATVQAERDVAHKEQQALRGWLQAARGRLDQAKADAMAEAVAEAKAQANEQAAEQVQQHALLKSRLSKLADESVEQEEQLKQAQERIDQLERDLADAQQSRKTAALESQPASISASNDDVAPVQMELQELERRCEDAVAEKGAVLEQLRESEQRHATIVAEKNTAVEQLQESKQLRESAVAEKDAVVEQMHEVEAAKDVAERKIQGLNLAAQSSAMAAEQEKANLQQKLAETQQLYDALISGNTDTVVAEMQQQLETAKGHRDEAQVQQQAAVAKVDEAQSELATVQAERDVAHKEQQALRGWLQAARGRLDQAKADAMAEAEQTKAAALAQAVATAKADALAEAAAAARAAQVDAEVQVGLETAGLTQSTKEKVATAPSSAAVIGSRMPTAPTMSASPAPPAAAVAARSFTLPPSPDRSRTEQPRLRWTPRGKQAADIIDKLREKVSDAHRDRDELHKQVSANGAQLFYRRMTLMTGVGVALITDMFVYWCSYSRCSVSSMHRWQDTRTLWSHS
eukprot:COSAG01_NODE_1074_length_11857_cov_21.092703_9_plen_886_part_00